MYKYCLSVLQMYIDFVTCAKGANSVPRHHILFTQPLYSILGSCIMSYGPLLTTKKLKIYCISLTVNVFQPNIVYLRIYCS